MKETLSTPRPPTKEMTIVNVHVEFDVMMDFPVDVPEENESQFLRGLMANETFLNDAIFSTLSELHSGGAATPARITILTARDEKGGTIQLSKPY